MAVSIQVSSDSPTLAPGAPVALFSTRIALGSNVGSGGFVSRSQYAIAPDGRFLLNVTAEETSPITIVQAWTAALNK